MGFFNKKEPSKEEQKDQDKKKEYEKVLSLSKLSIPEKHSLSFKGREYKHFLSETETKPTTFFEKTCKLFEKVNIKPTGDMEKELAENIKTSFMNATPTGVFSTAIVMAILGLILSIFVIIVDMTFGVLLAGIAAGLGWYIYNYPKTRSRIMEMKMSSDTVLAILYMVVYMRTSPNVDGALRFAASNLSGPLSWDLKKLMWDMEVGKYSSANEALSFYIDKWKDKNPEFAEALHLLKDSAVEPSRREHLYKETIDIVLNGTKERAKHYAAGLRMPMMLIHAMGVLLPVMGLILFPVVIIFMADTVKPAFIFIGYNILLPAALWFFTNYILESKPATFSQPDISKAKGIPPMGKFRLGKSLLPVWPFALIAGMPLLFLGILGISNPKVFLSVSYSLAIVLSAAITISVYCYLDYFQKMKIRKDIEKIENEFSVALFQLGNQLSGGAPLEIAVDRAADNLKNLEIANLFRDISNNMKKFGYTFEQAMLDEKVGALWNYPSKLIESIMKTVLESSKKSLSSAAGSMMTISEYLKGMHVVKEDIEEILGETLSSMRFLAMILAPMVAGITVTMAVVIIQILVKMGTEMGGIMASGDMSTAGSMMVVPWAMGGTVPIDPWAFQLVVGIYMIETAILLSMFLNRILYGEDKIGMRSTIASTLMIGVIIYVLAWFITYNMFGGTIESLIAPG